LVVNVTLIDGPHGFAVRRPTPRIPPGRKSVYYALLVALLVGLAALLW